MEDEGGELVATTAVGRIVVGVVQVVDEGVEEDEVLGRGGDGVAAACFSSMRCGGSFFFFYTCGWDGRGRGREEGKKGGRAYRGRISTPSRRPWSRPSRRLCRP